MSDNDWEEALDSLSQSLTEGDAGGWEVELVRRRVHDEIERLQEHIEELESQPVGTIAEIRRDCALRVLARDGCIEAMKKRIKELEGKLAKDQGE